MFVSLSKVVLNYLTALSRRSLGKWSGHGSLIKDFDAQNHPHRICRELAEASRLNESLLSFKEPILSKQTSQDRATSTCNHSTPKAILAL